MARTTAACRTTAPSGELFKQFSTRQRHQSLPQLLAHVGGVHPELWRSGSVNVQFVMMLCLPHVLA